MIACRFIGGRWKGILAAVFWLSGCQASFAAGQAPALPLFPVSERGQPESGQDAPVASPDLFQDTRVVAYDYDPNRTYPVRSRVKVFTEIVVPDDEKIVAWYPSADDKRGWPYTVSSDRQHVFVMPMQAGTVNTATLLTDKHSYLLTFEAVDSGIWFQRVQWVVPEADSSELPTQYEAPASDAAADGNAPAGPDLESMFVGYTIHGNAAFAPTLVADDGRFTWFRLSPNVQELPALFVLNNDDKPELVNYTMDQSNLIKAQRTSDAWLLKLGDEEVKVTVKSRKSHSLFGWFD